MMQDDPIISIVLTKLEESAVLSQVTLDATNDGHQCVLPGVFIGGPLVWVLLALLEDLDDVHVKRVEGVVGEHLLPARDHLNLDVIILLRLTRIFIVLGNTIVSESFIGKVSEVGW
jgi:hypothetical protein